MCTTMFNDDYSDMETYVSFRNLTDFFKYIAEHYNEIDEAMNSDLYEVSINVRSLEKRGNYFKNTAQITGNDREATLYISMDITDMRTELQEITKRMNIIRDIANNIPIDKVFEEHNLSENRI